MTAVSHSGCEGLLRCCCMYEWLSLFEFVVLFPLRIFRLFTNYLLKCLYQSIWIFNTTVYNHIHNHGPSKVCVQKKEICHWDHPLTLHMTILINLIHYQSISSGNIWNLERNLKFHALGCRKHASLLSKSQWERFKEAYSRKLYLLSMREYCIFCHAVYLWINIHKEVFSIIQEPQLF